MTDRFVVGDPDVEDHTHFYIQGHPFRKTSVTQGHDHVVTEGAQGTHIAQAAGHDPHMHMKFTPFDNQGE